MSPPLRSPSLLSPALQCPHCKASLSPHALGVFHCGGCGKPFTVPGPEEFARREKKRQDDRNVLKLVGGAFFLVYVAPVLFSLLSLCLMMVFYLVLFAVFALGSLAS